MSNKEKTSSAAEQQLLEALGDLAESISFCASGTCALVLPGLTVDGVGEIALPISKTDARKLTKKSSPAPFGRGEATIIDHDVRRVWQLEPDEFKIENSKWQLLVRDIVKSVKSEFGVKQKVTADPYKLLVYEKGSFFVPHRDTEKAHRMFATLVICLPSKHKGGELIVSHAGQSHVVDFSGITSNYELQYSAFYADCKHEVRPVTDGYRVCLVYNLSTGGRKTQPAAPEFGGSVESATHAIREVFRENDERDMIILPLMHQYTEAGLAPDASDDVSDNDAWDEDDWDEDEDDETDELEEQDKPDNFDDESTGDEAWDYEAPGFKPVPRQSAKPANANVTPVPLEFKGADRALTDVLGQVAARTNCRAFVALMTHWQSGYPDYGSIDYEPSGRHWGHGHENVSDQNEGAEFEHVEDESISLKHWHTLDGRRQPFDELSIDESDIVTDVDDEDRP